jgi:hypothetical protein
MTRGVGYGYDAVTLKIYYVMKGSFIQMEIIDQVTHFGSADPAYKSLYKIGAAAALIAGLIFRRNLDAEFMLLRTTGIIRIGPTAPPSAVIGWFTLLQNNKLLGLTMLNLFDLVNYALVGLIFLALYVALRRASESFMAIAASLGFVGITVYFASNQSFSMLSLSSQYAAAATDAQRAMFLAAGQEELAIHNNASYQGSGIYMSFLLVSLAGLIISAVMLRSNIFSKDASYVGLLANGFGLGYYIALAFAPAMVAIPLSASALFLLAWYILIGVRLWIIGSTRAASSINSESSRKKDVFQQL